MFNSLWLLLITTLCLQYASSRHLVQQPYYLPYSDYSYTYSGPGPLYHQQHHSPFFSPPGTYFDHRQGILRPFLGGGVPVLLDYFKRCPNQYVGLKAHPGQPQYYYVCKPDCVIFGKCQNLQVFNATCGQCVQHPPPEYKPTCTEIGRFPLFSDCHLYYKCEEDLQPKIYSCPASMVFSPTSKKCIEGHKCTPTKISPHSSYIPEVCASKFPPCFESGIFRSPSDCSLYYKCDLKNNNVYMQTRLRCAQGDFFDLQKSECLPAKKVPCDCIQVAELVYPKPHTMHYEPAVYPAQFELDSLEDGYYPIEQTREESKTNCNTTDGKNNADLQTEVTTTLTPSISETTLNNEVAEENDTETAVLSDYIDMGDKDNKSLSKELEQLTPNPPSSDETDSTEDDFEETANLNQEDENRTTIDKSNNEIEGTVDNATQENATTNEASTEITDESDNRIEDSENIATEGEEANNFEETETVTAFKELEQEEETTTARISSQRREVEITTSTKGLEQEEETTTSLVPTRSNKLQPCENVVDFGESNDADTHTKDTTKTQTANCLPKLIPNISNFDSQPKRSTIISEDIPSSRNTLHEHNSTIMTTVTTIPNALHLATSKITPASDNLVITQLQNENIDENNLQSHLIDSEATHSSMKTIQEIEKIIHSFGANIEKLQKDKNLKQTNNIDNIKLSQIVHARSLDTNSIEDYDSLENLLNYAEPTKIPRDPTAINADAKKFVKQTESVKKGEDDSQNLQSSEKKQLEVQKPSKPDTSTSKITQATTIKSDSKTPVKKILLDGTSDNTTDFTVGDEVNLLDSEIKINDSKTSTQTDENLNVNHLSNADILSIDSTSTITDQEHISRNKNSVDFRDEELIPVNSKSIAVNKLSEETRFEDDYTTIISEEDFSNTEATETTKGVMQQKHKVKTTQSDEKETILRRRQATLDGTTQLTTIKAPTQPNFGAADSSNTVTDKPTTTVKTEKNSILKNFHDVVIQSQEVSKNEITSVETNETTSSSKSQQFPHTPLRPFTRTQMPKDTPKVTTPEPSEQQTDNLTIHVRKDDHKQSSQNSPPSQSLYYILETTPVINNNDNKSNNEIVTAATPGIKSNNRSIPRLEIIAERPIDVHLSICPPTCDKNHTHNIDSPVGKRAVLLKWFANKSKQTMGFETANELNTDDD